VAEPTERAYESIVQELDDDLSDPEPGPSLLLEADPAHGLLLATAGLTRREGFAEVLDDPGLGRVRLIKSPAWRGRIAWKCSCGEWEELAPESSFEEAAQAYLAAHRRADEKRTHNTRYCAPGPWIAASTDRPRTGARLVPPPPPGPGSRFAEYRRAGQVGQVCGVQPAADRGWSEP
jgi:hypothetical protein